MYDTTTSSGGFPQREARVHRHIAFEIADFTLLKRLQRKYAERSNGSTLVRVLREAAERDLTEADPRPAGTFPAQRHPK